MRELAGWGGLAGLQEGGAGGSMGLFVLVGG